MTLVLTLGVLGLARAALELRGREYQGYTRFIEMQPLLPQARVTLLDAPPAELPARTPGVSAVERRGLLRVGYTPDRLPYAFRNEAGQIVGLDVEMAHQLARELDVPLEFVRVPHERVAELLNAGYLDVLMSGYAVTTERLKDLSVSASYLDETLAFVVRDHRRDEFRTAASVRAHKALRVSMPPIDYYTRIVSEFVPQAELVPMHSPRDFFKAEEGEYDAAVFSAESGSAWTLIYPAFTVVVPHPTVLKVPLVYPVARGDARMVEFMSTWIDLKRKDGTLDRLYEHWILGADAADSGPRWSVIRNVLGWVD